MSEKRFSDEDIGYLCKVLDEKFLIYYQMTRDKMTLSERLLFEDISKNIQDGFFYVINEGFDD